MDAFEWYSTVLLNYFQGAGRDTHVVQQRYALSKWRSHFHTNFSFQHAHHLATLLSAQQAHFNIAAIFQQHFKMHFNISFDAHYYAFDHHHASLHCSLHLLYMCVHADSS
jgi:hypothetical protein